jgi:hypothetical protein
LRCDWQVRCHEVGEEAGAGAGLAQQKRRERQETYLIMKIVKYLLYLNVEKSKPKTHAVYILQARTLDPFFVFTCERCSDDGIPKFQAQSMGLHPLADSGLAAV